MSIQEKQNYNSQWKASKHAYIYFWPGERLSISHDIPAISFVVYTLFRRQTLARSPCLVFLMRAYLQQKDFLLVEYNILFTLIILLINLLWEERDSMHFFSFKGLTEFTFFLVVTCFRLIMCAIANNHILPMFCGIS